MSLIQLPEFIYTGMNSLSKILDFSYKSILIITDSETAEKSEVLKILLSKADEKKINSTLVSGDSCISIFSQVEEKLMDVTPEALIAFGDGKILDCVSAISSLSEIPFATIPSVAPTALWDSDSVDAFLSKKLSRICILEPEMIIRANSTKIAYEGMAMLALAGESMQTAQNRYVKSLAQKAFYEIFNNLFSAYTGEISARENLLEGMYWAYVAYVNSYEFSWESALYRYCDFFSAFEIDKLSLLAVSSVQILKEASVDENLIDKVRRLRAKLSIPKSVKNLSVDEEIFLQKTEVLGDEEKELFSACYYGEQISQLA